MVGRFSVDVMIYGMKQAEVFTLIQKAVHALSKKHFQTLSVLLVWQSSLQTEPVIRYRKDTVGLLAYLEFKIETQGKAVENPI